MAELGGRVTVGVQLHVGGDALNGILVSFYFGFVGHIGQGVQNTLRQLVRIDQLLSASFEPVDGHFLHFQLIYALAVLVDQAHHTLQELLQGLALEIQAHQVTRVVPVGLE